MSGAVPDPPKKANPKNGSLTILTTMAEVRDASLRVANSCNRVLSIFTHDLEPQIYGEELFHESVKRLVLARAYAKVRVLIADPARAVVDKNRFMAMARRLTSCIDMRSMGEDVAATAGAFIIADDRALVYRPRAASWDGMSDMNDAAVAKIYLNFFEEIWSNSVQESQLRQMLV